MLMTGKKALSDLALFGGKPLFSQVKSIGQLAQPNQARFFALARKCFAERRLSNNGPMVQLLERRLADFHRVPCCIAYANAGLALIALIQSIAAGRTGSVVIPTFTYAGLPHIVRWAGQVPLFCDVDRDTHTLTAETASAAMAADTIMLLGVHQANSPCPIDELEALCRARGITLLFDSVHGLGATYAGTPIGGFGQAEVFSLHATKLLNGFEGGYITTHDENLADLLRRKRNFGFTGESSIDTLGMNAKLNELHAASALAALDDLPALIERNRSRIEAYRESFADIPGISWIPYATENKTNHEFPLLQIAPDWPLARDTLVSILRAEGALARPYYAPPLHLQDNPSHAPLPVAEALSGQIVQMPAGESLSRDGIDTLAALVDFAYIHAESISSALAADGTSR